MTRLFKEETAKREEARMSLLQLSEKNFEQEVVKSNIPVLVDFWAEWCGPCRMIGPIVDELAKEYTGKIKVGKVNVDEAQSLAVRFNVMSIPTLIFFKNGEAVDQIIGAMPKEELAEKINENL